MPRLLEIKPREGFRIWVRYEDGAQGEVDLSDLAGRGVFAAWNDPEFFRCVRVGSAGEPSWGDRIDLCPDAVYMRLTGKTPAEVLPSLKRAGVDP